MEIGDAVEVLVMTRRGKQPEWIPATVHAMYPDGAVTVEFEGGSRQKFVIDTDRIRTPGGQQEGAEWVFSTF